MKELDLVLLRYLHGRWPAADAAEKAAFERLLDLPDPVIADYLFARAFAPDGQIGDLVEHMRAQ